MWKDAWRRLVRGGGQEEWDEFFIKKAVSGKRTVERDGKEEKKEEKYIYIYCENRVWKGERKGWPSNV